jgi:hypothetical protein
MVTIQSLEVTFEVDGESDEAVFARLFTRHITGWSRQRDEELQRRVTLESDRALGDRPTGGALP